MGFVRDIVVPGSQLEQRKHLACAKLASKVHNRQLTAHNSAPLGLQLTDQCQSSHTLCIRHAILYCYLGREKQLLAKTLILSCLGSIQVSYLSVLVRHRQSRAEMSATTYNAALEINYRVAGSRIRTMDVVRTLFLMGMFTNIPF